MKMFRYLVVGFCLCLLMNSCDFMDKKPLDIISSDVVWNDEAMVQSVMADIMEQMSFLYHDANYQNKNYFHSFPMHTACTIADEARQTTMHRPEYKKWGPGTQTKDGGFNEQWLYPTIRKLNEVIENLQISQMDRATADLFILRARWCRAMCYYAMVVRYGGIPIITKVQNIDDPEQELYVSRNKEIEVYDFIINEMDEIGDLLPHRDKTGYPCKWAAYALKSRAAMFAASIATWGEVQLDGLVGIPSSEAKRFWQICYDASDKLIKEGGYTLYNKYPNDKVKNYHQLFIDDDNPEYIMVLQFVGAGEIGGGRNHGWDNFTAPQGTTAWAGSCVGVYLEMIEEYENIDGTVGTFNREKYCTGLWSPQEIFKNKEPRFFADIITEGSPWQGKKIEYYTRLIKPDGSTLTGTEAYEGVPATGANTRANGGVTGFTAYKGCTEDLVLPGNWDSEADVHIFRLAEIYLNMAEACFELGKNDEALHLINKIRERAGVKLLTSIDRDKIRHERKIELAFESNRWYDLRRWRIAEKAISKRFSGLQWQLDYNSLKSGKRLFKVKVVEGVDGEFQKYFPKRLYYLPITPKRISNNPNLAPENPNWD